MTERQKPSGTRVWNMPLKINAEPTTGNNDCIATGMPESIEYVKVIELAAYDSLQSKLAEAIAERDAAEKRIFECAVSKADTFAMYRSALKERDQALEMCQKLAAALTAIEENTSELQPNSGHMYLANINYCDKKARAAVAEYRQWLERKGRGS